MTKWWDTLVCLVGYHSWSQTPQHPHKSTRVHNTTTSPQIFSGPFHSQLPYTYTELKIRAIYHAQDLWKLAPSCKQLHLLCLPDPTKFTRYYLQRCKWGLRKKAETVLALPKAGQRDRRRRSWGWAWEGVSPSHRWGSGGPPPGKFCKKWSKMVASESIWEAGGDHLHSRHM